MRLCYTITQIFGRRRRSAVLASENICKHLMLPVVHPRQTGATSEAQFVGIFNLSTHSCSFLRSYFCMKDLTDFLIKIINILPFFLFFFLISLVLLKCCVSIGFLFHLILRLNSNNEAEFHPVKLWIDELFIGMEDEIIETPNFFIIAIIILFLIPPYFLAVVEIHRNVFNNTLEAWMLVFLIFLAFVISLLSLFFGNWARFRALFTLLSSTSITGAEFLMPRCYFSWLFSPNLSKIGTGTLQ